MRVWSLCFLGSSGGGVMKPCVGNDVFIANTSRVLHINDAKDSENAIRKAGVFVCRCFVGVLLFICALSVSNALLAQTQVIVTNANPQGWAVASQRADSTVDITTNQPRSGTGSLEFVTNFVTPGQDKVDYELLWDPANFPNRTLSNLSALSYEYRRDSSSAVGGAFHPVLRLRWYNDNATPMDTADDTLGQLIYEEVYQGVNPVPVDTWDTNDIDLAAANLWMFCNDCGGGATGVVQNYSASISDWLAGPVVGQPGDPVPPDLSVGTTFVFGMNTGVGSGWSDDLLMWVDNVRIAFGMADDLNYNFEGPVPVADLSVVKTADTAGPVTVGDTIVYTITVTNNGPDDATNVQVTDTLPAAVSYVSDDCGAMVVGQDLTWDIGTLANGLAAICMITVDVSQIDSADNTAMVSAVEMDPDSMNNSGTALINGVLPPAIIVPVLSAWSFGLMLLAFLLIGVIRLRRNIF